jgi:hypothetical protein
MFNLMTLATSTSREATFEAGARLKARKGLQYDCSVDHSMPIFPNLERKQKYHSPKDRCSGLP